MKKNYFKFLLFAFLFAFCGFVANAASPIFSQYGQIQNVQNYSTNPFWSPNAPYNQRLPQPVYVNGADLNADDCIKVVQSLVAAQCMARDNCKDTDLTDIRPTIMVQLSNLPGANYVSACSGYLDGIFESYVQQYGNTLPNRPTAFPDATVPNPDLDDSSGIKFENPYKQQPAKWQIEMRERSNELQSLQNENGADKYSVSATDFPTTYQDVSFSARMENERAGLEPYKDMIAYKTINAKTEAEWCSDSSHYNSGECAAYKAKQEAAAQAAAQAVASQTTATQDQEQPASTIGSDEQAAIDAIVAFLNPQTKEEKRFFTDLATDFVPKAFKDDNLMLDNSFVYDFLANNDADLTKYKSGLLTLSGTAENEELHIDLDWDDILIQISTLLDATKTRRGALVCENNRSYQIGIDTAFWIGTAAAAIVSFGTGGVAAAGAHAALGAGLKALAKGATKVGLKSAGKSMARAGMKQTTKAALKIGLKTSVKEALSGAKKGFKGALAKRIAKQAGQNLATKRGLLLASGAVAGAIYETLGKNTIASHTNSKEKSFSSKAAGTLYSLVESEPSTEIINCQDIDYGEGCYAVCGHDKPDDDLNTKVFKPILGHNYCVNENDFTLYDMQTNEPLMMTPEEYAKVTTKIRAEVADQGKMQDKWKTLTNQRNGRHGCDWNEDDIDMYFGTYIYDPDTFEPSSNMIIEEVIRIDD